MASSSGTRCSSASDPSSGPSYERGAARSALAVCSTGVARARTYNPQSAVGSLDTSAKLIACIAVVVIILSACRGSVGLVTATTITFPADGRRRRGLVLRGGRRTGSSTTGGYIAGTKRSFVAIAHFLARAPSHQPADHKLGWPGQFVGGRHDGAPTNRIGQPWTCCTQP